MSEGSSRRGFLKAIFGEAAQRAPKLVPAAPLLGLIQPPTPETPLQPRAAPASRTASLEDLRKLTVKAGLLANLEAVESLAVPSFRLIVRPETRRAPAQPPAPAAAGPEPDTRACELLLCLFFDGAMGGAVPNAPSLTGTLTVELDDARRCHLTFTEPPRPDEPGWGQDRDPARPGLATHRRTSAPLALTPSAELVIPRAWSDQVQSLGLTEEETQRWTELREYLAAFQGAELPGEQEEPPVIHRLLGYPDERTGDMPLACELAVRNLAHDGPPFSHPRAAELAPGAARWRLLLQLSADEALDWFWGTADKRLYVWIDEADLAAGDLSRTHTIIQ